MKFGAPDKFLSFGRLLSSTSSTFQRQELMGCTSLRADFLHSKFGNRGSQHSEDVCGFANMYTA